LVAPDQVLAPYDVALTGASRRERREWARSVVGSIRDVLGDVAGTTFEIHAGAAYTDFGLVDGLRGAGATVELPVGGLSLGQQLSWYRTGERPSRAAVDPSPHAGPVARPARRSGGKYEPLAAHLEALAARDTTMSFADVEQILGAPLPASARNHRPWWANGGHSQAAAWMGAGWAVDTVNLASERVRFRRVR
jgi:hypothetical protein